MKGKAKKDNPIIPLSFKNTDEDNQLFNWLKTKSSLSGFIKDILRQVMNKELNNK